MPTFWLNGRGDVLIEAPHAKAALRKAERLGLGGVTVSVIQLPGDPPGPRDRLLTRREAQQAGIFREGDQ